MCGIVGYIGTQTAIDVLMNGLERLEYRGSDSAGVATILEGELHCTRAKGKLYNLREKLGREVNPARIGIGHTRWATHGKPEENNAHPHRDGQGRVAVVQNGIVENYQVLREELIAKGHQFVSETDTEVIHHLIADLLHQNASESLFLVFRLYLAVIRHENSTTSTKFGQGKYRDRTIQTTNFIMIGFR
jgi:glucosamine--fructose-6-phosphate aminotransferase (isomerizing)